MATPLTLRLVAAVSFFLLSLNPQHACIRDIVVRLSVCVLIIGGISIRNIRTTESSDIMTYSIQHVSYGIVS